MFLLLFIVFLSSLTFWNFVWKRRCLPPGPIPLPILGNTLSFFNRSIYAPFQEWAQQFGPIYTFWLAETPVVVVSDYKLMVDLFIKQGDLFTGRHFFTEFAKASKAIGGLTGITVSQGEQWKVLRRFAMQSMRTLGIGKASHEKSFLKDIDEMIRALRADIEANGGHNKSLKLHLDRLIGSAINRIVFGYAFDDDHLEEFLEQKAVMDDNDKLQASVQGNILAGFIWLRHFPPFASTWAKIDANTTAEYNFIDKQIQKRIGERKAGRGSDRQEPKDLLDCFLDKMENQKDQEEEEEDKERKHFNMPNLRTFCFELFFAGQETTASTLNFLLLYVLLDQRVQGKIHTELDQFVSEKDGETMITLADRPCLPYVNAVINETQRLCNLLPLNLTHKTMGEVEVMGKYRLSEGTNIVPQISCVLYDSKIFPNPDQFIPERFIDEEGQLKKCEELIPFSLGKRSCLGEALARMEMFLFTASFFRNFHINPSDSSKPPRTDKENSFIVRPYPYKCHIELRD